ncbi:lipoprotein [Marinobacter hydrocarbonoclasticus]|nr:lipoprotein [Marinobacter nauticus]
MQRLTLAVLLLLGLSACGQKGPLYLPETPESNQTQPEQSPVAASENQEQGN